MKVYLLGFLAVCTVLITITVIRRYHTHQVPPVLVSHNAYRLLDSYDEAYGTTKYDEPCPYEAGECPNTLCVNGPKLHDYQIELHMDTMWVYDGPRLVGTLINTKWDSKLDSLILQDNQ